MSISEIQDLSTWIRERREAWAALTPEARSYKRVRGRERTPAEKMALVLAGKRAWDEWIRLGKIKETEYGYKLCVNVNKKE